MIENYAQFTPVASTVGGIIIGIASVFMMIVFGRIAGVSGILGSMIALPKNDSLWRFAFIFGIISSGIFFSQLIDFNLLNEGTGARSSAVIIISGLLVGLGTRIGSGCTSGHGICGIGRLSLRSIAATITFVASAMITVFLAKLIS